MVRVCRICTSSGHAPQRKKKHNGPPFSPSLSLPTTSQPTHFLPKVRLRAPCRALPSCDVRRCLPMAWLAIPEGSAVCSMMLCLPSCSCTLLPRSCPHPPRHPQHSFAPAVLLVHPPAPLFTACFRPCPLHSPAPMAALHACCTPLATTPPTHPLCRCCVPPCCRPRPVRCAAWVCCLRGGAHCTDQQRQRLRRARQQHQRQQQRLLSPSWQGTNPWGRAVRRVCNHRGDAAAIVLCCVFCLNTLDTSGMQGLGARCRYPSHA